MLWLALFRFPLMTVVQEMCARIGLVTGNGLASVIKKRYSRKVVFPIASLLLIANTINIGADIGSMAASIRLVFPPLLRIVATLFYSIYPNCRNYCAVQKLCEDTEISYAFSICIYCHIYNCRWSLEPVSHCKHSPHVEITPAFAMMLTIHKKAKLTWLTLASRPLIGILCPRTLVADSPLSLCYQQHSLPLYKTD
jgi:hypothetical protein